MVKKGVPVARVRKKRGRGRPPVHSERWSKVSVVLFNRQIVSLDRLATEIRRHTGQVLNRAGIIRALIDAVVDSRLDLTRVTSEAELKQYLAHAITDAPAHGD